MIQSPSNDESHLNRGMQALFSKWRQTLAAGNHRVGWKMASLATKSNLLQIQSSAPVVGFLTSDRLLSPGCVYTLKKETTIMVEAEVGIVLGRDVIPGTNKEAATLAIEAFTPALELVDVARPSSNLEEIVKGNLFHEAVIFGAKSPEVGNFSTQEVDARVLRNGAEACVGDPSRIPNDIGQLISMLADTLGKFGECLRKGDRIISGSITKPLPVHPGDDVVVDLGKLGQISIQFIAA